MSVLAAIFAHAGEIAFDIARIEGGVVERGITVTLFDVAPDDC